MTRLPRWALPGDPQWINRQLERRGVTSKAMAERGVRVLVVDDDEVVRQLIGVNLELDGFEVSTAGDGFECLEKARHLHPGVITLDIMMPRMDGWETARRLRADPATAGATIAVVTARAQQADLRRGREVGADAYLTKPFDPDELIATVRALATAPASYRVEA